MAHDTAHETEHHEDHHDGHHAHVTPFGTMFAVLLVLLFLTVFTVLTAKYVDLGSMNLVLAMAIAIVKGTLVFGFFMHLVYDKLLNTVVVLSTLFAVTLFIGFSVLDLNSRARIDRIQEGEVVTGGLKEIVSKAIERAEAEHHSAEHHGDAAHDDAEGDHDAHGETHDAEGDHGEQGDAHHDGTDHDEDH